MAEVTRLLDAGAAGDPKAATDLLPLVYSELRRLAADKLAHENPGHTLQPTALVFRPGLVAEGDRGGLIPSQEGKARNPGVGRDPISLTGWRATVAPHSRGVPVNERSIFLAALDIDDPRRRAAYFFFNDTATT